MFIDHDDNFVSPSPFMSDRNIALLTELMGSFGCASLYKHSTATRLKTL